MPTEKTQNTQDPNSVYFSNNSDVNSSKLVNSVFHRTIEFNDWKRAMTIYLSADNKLSFIDGSLAGPATTS